MRNFHRSFVTELSIDKSANVTHVTIANHDAVSGRYVM